MSNERPFPEKQLKMPQKTMILTNSAAEFRPLFQTAADLKLVKLRRSARSYNSKQRASLKSNTNKKRLYLSRFLQMSPRISPKHVTVLLYRTVSRLWLAEMLVTSKQTI